MVFIEGELANFKEEAMRAGLSVSQWTAAVEETLREVCHGHLRKALAAFSLAMVEARSCCALQMALCLEGSALFTSVRRRLERLLANDRLDVLGVYQAIATALAASRRGGRLVLIMDESDRGPTLRSFQILAAVKHRCVPLLAVAYHPRRPPMSMDRLVPEQLQMLGQWLGDYDLQITLLADRGLSWPVVVRTCQQLGWHYVLRLQGQTRMLRSNGKEMTLGKLLGKKLGMELADGVMVFKKAGWISHCSITAVRVKGCKSPWYLLSDTPAGAHQVSRYTMRMWCEQSFRDEKSSGFHWRESRVNDPAHATRLLLVMALAMWLCMLIGMGVVRRGWRKQLDYHAKRHYSYFKLGLMWIIATLRRDLPLFPLTIGAL